MDSMHGSQGCLSYLIQPSALACSLDICPPGNFHSFNLHLIHHPLHLNRNIRGAWDQLEFDTFAERPISTSTFSVWRYLPRMAFAQLTMGRSCELWIWKTRIRYGRKVSLCQDSFTQDAIKIGKYFANILYYSRELTIDSLENRILKRCSNGSRQWYTILGLIVLQVFRPLLFLSTVRFHSCG